MRITLIHHPDAGEEDQPDADALVRLLKKHHHEVQYQSADEPAWAAALDEPTDLVVVAGGDGTVGRVAKKLIGRDLLLAPLPLGTANNIATTLGLIDSTLDEIVEGWREAAKIPFDVGVATGPWGSRYFIEAFGVGLFACTIAAADKSKTLEAQDTAEAKVAYAIGMLRRRLHKTPAHRLDLVLDGNPYPADYVLLEAMNMAFVGPNLYLAPGLDADDGLLDVVLVTDEERHALEEPLANWQKGDLHVPELTRRRASSIELEWSGFDVHFDDEAWPPRDAQKDSAQKRITLSVEHSALKFFAPRGKGEHHS